MKQTLKSKTIHFFKTFSSNCYKKCIKSEKNANPMYMCVHKLKHTCILFNA